MSLLNEKELRQIEQQLRVHREAPRPPLVPGFEPADTWIELDQDARPKSIHAFFFI